MRHIFVIPTLIFALLTGCASPAVKPSLTTAATVKPSLAVQAPPMPPGMTAAKLGTNSAQDIITPQPATFTHTLAWDTYSNNIATNFFIQGSDDGTNWTNEVQVVPIWATNAWKLTETNAKHFYRLMVQ
jgi:hypothetical protein